MSMDFSEYLRRLGADPDDPDPEMERARRSDPAFEQAADDARRLQNQLERAARLPAPDDLVDDILLISRNSRVEKSSPRWRQLGMAAGLLIAVGAAGLAWNATRGWESVDEYVVDHYRHDGDRLLLDSAGVAATDVQELFARFGVTAQPPLARDISLIKYCPTPDGRGIHMVVDTAQGPVTVIYMPETGVTDGAELDFDTKRAHYVRLSRGSAIVIADQNQSVDAVYSLVQNSIMPVDGKA